MHRAGGLIVGNFAEIQLATRNTFMELEAKPENIWIGHTMPKSWNAN
jgi:hypothetical protein